MKYDLGRQGRANSVFEGMQMSLSYSADGRQGNFPGEGAGAGEGTGTGERQELT